MKKLVLFISLFFCFTQAALADHITGGEMYYTLNGVTNGMYRYNFTLKLFMRCNSGRQFINPTTVSVFDRSNFSQVQSIGVNLDHTETISLSTPDPCITNPPAVCYVVGYYRFELSLPGNASGYVVSSHVNYRINNITNLMSGYAQVGAVYTAEIPGMQANANNPSNNSANFADDDLVIICADNSFTYNFAAVDGDGDQLRYSFCEAYQSGTTGTGGAPPPPPYNSVPYGNGFDGSSPLGPAVTINPGTGQLRGIAPSSGIYVVTVCVQEIRGGVVIAQQRKDLQIFIAPCTIAAASLANEYQLCDTTMTIRIENQSNSPLIQTYNWEVRSFISGAVLFSTSNSTLDFSFPDTGLYTVTLEINRGKECSDSTKSLVRVYPGFAADFNVSGLCLSKPSVFEDRSTSVYGVASSWNWDLGEPTSAADVSSLRTVTYTYPTTGIKEVKLIVRNSKGCVDTINRSINVYDKPPLSLAFRDTLICVPDAVQLRATGTGQFSWTPSFQIMNASTSAPTVAPATTTTYHVLLNDNGCLNNDSVRVRVVNSVSLQMMPDTIICQHDTIQLRVSSDAFQYSWTPASQFINSSVRNPMAITPANTVYQVTARIGSCTATGQVRVATVPYPVVHAGADTVICFGNEARLSGTSDGSSFTWTPAASLSGAATLNPVARPVGTTQYILTARDTMGCPKPSRDTVTVLVLDEIRAFAGRDTSVIVGQSLQLNATGGLTYLWSPATGLSAVGVPNPVAQYNSPFDGIRYRVLVFNDAGCVDSAFIKVRVFGTRPTVFVPSAFTPNGDGKNDRLFPIAAGMLRIDYFQVYNRWGQLVYSSSDTESGWDGKINGQLQATSTFVWVVKGVDYTGVPYSQRGTVTLIR
jgi:gliding motility-associated-like protein